MCGNVATACSWRSLKRKPCSKRSSRSRRCACACARRLSSSPDAARPLPRTARQLSALNVQALGASFAVLCGSVSSGGGTLHTTESRRRAHAAGVGAPSRVPGWCTMLAAPCRALSRAQELSAARSQVGVDRKDTAAREAELQAQIIGLQVNDPWAMGRPVTDPPHRRRLLAVTVTVRLHAGLHLPAFA